MEKRLKSRNIIYYIPLIILSISCNEKDRQDGEGSGGFIKGSAVLSPDKGNSVGLYGLVANPLSGTVFYTNLHTPTAGVVDGVSGELLHVIDLLDTLGEGLLYYPEIEYNQVFSLFYVNDAIQDRLIIIDDTALTVFTHPDICSTPRGMWVDQDSGDLYLSCAGDLEVRRLSGDDLESLGTYETSSPPFYSHPDTRSNLLFTLCSGPYSLNVHDLESGEPVEVISLRGEPRFLDIDQERGLVLITNRLTGTLDIIDESSLTRYGEIPLLSDPYGIYVLEQEEKAFVVNRQGDPIREGGAYRGDPSKLSVIDLDSMESEGSLDLAKTAHFITHDPVLNRLYVGNEDSISISFIDGMADEVLFEGGPYGLTLDQLCIDRDSERIFIPSHLTDELIVIDRETLELIKRVETGGWPVSCAVEEGGRIFVSEQDRGLVEVFRTMDLTLEKSLDLGVGSNHYPCDPLCRGHTLFTCIAVDSGRERAYITNPPSNTLSVIDTSELEILDTLVLGEAVDPEIGEGIRYIDVKVAAGDGSIYIHNPVTGDLLRIGALSLEIEAFEEDVPFPSSMWSIHIDESGQRLFAGRRVFDPLTLKEISEIHEEGGERIFGTLPSGDLLCEGSDGFTVLRGDNFEIIKRITYDSFLYPPYYLNDLFPVVYEVDDGVDRVLAANLKRGTIESFFFRDLR